MEGALRGIYGEILFFYGNRWDEWKRWDEEREAQDYWGKKNLLL